jgi:hypothetical protein
MTSGSRVIELWIFLASLLSVTPFLMLLSDQISASPFERAVGEDLDQTLSTNSWQQEMRKPYTFLQKVLLNVFQSSALSWWCDLAFCADLAGAGTAMVILNAKALQLINIL